MEILESLSNLTDRINATKVAYVKSSVPTYSESGDSTEECIDAYALTGEFSSPRLFMRYYPYRMEVELHSTDEYSGGVVPLGTIKSVSKHLFEDLTDSVAEFHVYHSDRHTQMYMYNMMVNMLRPFHEY